MELKEIAMWMALLAFLAAAATTLMHVNPIPAPSIILTGSLAVIMGELLARDESKDEDESEDWE